MPQKLVNIRISTHLLARLDRLREWAETQPDLVPSGAATQADLHRAALVAGLAVLEKRSAHWQPEEVEADEETDCSVEVRDAVEYVCSLKLPTKEALEGLSALAPFTSEEWSVIDAANWDGRTRAGKWRRALAR